MSKEAMKLALEALKDATLHIWLGDKKGSEANIRAHKAIDVLEVELAKQEQGEPVAWMRNDEFKAMTDIEKQGWIAADEGKEGYWSDVVKDYTIPLYTTSQQRTWVGLSVFEINDLVDNTEYEDYCDLVERTEAKLKEKNT